jgi:autoinducer 2-degrading protein
MIVTMVHVHVKPDCVDGFIAATLGNHAGSVAEAGNRRFDLLQDPADPTRFVIYEAFLTEADIAAHKETPHYWAWRKAVDGMMADTRTGVRWTCLAPTE